MKRITVMVLCCVLLGTVPVLAQKNTFNGLGSDLGNLYRLSDAKTRSISPENFTGAKGQGGRATTGTGQNASRDLGLGWKVSPSIIIKPGQTAVVAEIDGAGAIQHIWLTPTGLWRFAILRMYWDDEKTPSVEVPVGDFFGQGWGETAMLNSIPVTVNPGSAFNCYWLMPFRKKCRITLENIDEKEMFLYYQVDYTLTEVPSDAAYFHAQFRRQNPTAYKVPYTILDGVKGRGQYVGTYLAWGVNSNDWWGEGEIKFFLDGDNQFPTINGTGTEDYFLGSYNFENKKTHQYQEYSTPYAGLHQVIRPDGLYRAQQRFGMYRWHIPDPIRFTQDLRVTIQALGWRYNGRYLPLQDDVASVAYWYQTEPHAPFPTLPSKDDLEVK
ncbi:glycoside hydrolase family 172 protein [Hymenobacter sp. GOD-10R]|uniref:glycoside hydrolase family 172 protein n=1 Tax=Hymenobacter sp. GOD-10R TaxID=3093922 RepID=UPI002D77C9B4|nr:glycoside hydrolase family 172 protein [Hymenobacter sp. GOD-10R]WRQ26536.1 glycoside hydrolase family 172 protein [Hymenobacter sp. GOD-10R]